MNTVPKCIALLFTLMTASVLLPAQTSTDTTPASLAEKRKQVEAVPEVFRDLIQCDGSKPPMAQDACKVVASPHDPLPLLYDGTAKTVYTDPVFHTRIKRITSTKRVAGHVGLGL